MPATSPTHPNLLLNALPGDVRGRLAPHLAEMAVPVGRVLHEPGVPVRVAYFPVTSVIAKLYVMENGDSAEVGLVGNEGMVGVSLFLADEAPASRAVVQAAGRCLALPAHALKAEFQRGGAMMHVLLRYTQTFIAQTVLAAACNRHGTLEQRLCRWMLQTLDRLPAGELEMTHEVVANALGATRAGVTEAAGRLRDEGAIRYHRGHVRVLDRHVLERHVCECYRTPRREPGRLVPG